MIPIKQKNLHDPDNGVWGDCHRAAIASIFEIAIEEIPNFGEGGPDENEFQRRVDEWLLDHGFRAVHAAYDSDLDQVMRVLAIHAKGTYYLFGATSNTGCGHTLVGCGGEIVHDPSLVNSGIKGPMEDGLYWITFLMPARLDAAFRAANPRKNAA